MESLVIWAFFAIVQQDGLVGLPFQTEAECNEYRAEVQKQPELIGLSECKPLTLVRKK
jgi:hypothetical protein